MTWLLEVVDPWTAAHLWVGYAAARLGIRFWPWLALSCAWEWLEASGAGPVGADASMANSVVDVVAGVLAWVVVRRRSLLEPLGSARAEKLAQRDVD